MSLSWIQKKCIVERLLFPPSSLHETLKPEGFWASNWYDGGTRFENIPDTIKGLDGFLSFCESCATKVAKESEKVPRLVENKDDVSIKWMGKSLRCGDGVMIPPNSVELPGKQAFGNANKHLEEQAVEVDNNIQTEYYRKNKKNIGGERGQEKNQCSPFQIGQIVETRKTKSISLKIRLFYRPGEFS